MTVSRLIEKLQTLPPNAIVLVDKSGDETVPDDIMGEAIFVAQGVAFHEHTENRGSDYWVSQSLSPAGPGEYHRLGEAAVYIGSGEAVVGPLWTKI